MPDFLGDLNAFRVALEANGLLQETAFADATITGVIDIDRAGRLSGARQLSAKERMRVHLPVLPKRTSNPVAAFLSGSGEYWAGSKRAIQRDLHQAVLADIDDADARAILAFFDRPPEPAVARLTGNSVLRIEGRWAHEAPALRDAWSAHHQPAEDLNPRIRVWPTEAYVRLGTSTNAESAKSHGGGDAHIRAMDPGGAARALNWLLDRPSTARHQHTAAIAWLAGDPLGDPTPMVCPLGRLPADWTAPQPINTLHVAMLKAYPPARMHLRWYWSGDAVEAFERLAAFDAQLRSSLPHYFTDNLPVRWPATFAGTPRYADMVVETLQCLLGGTPLPHGVMCELVRLHRKPSKLPNEPLAFAMLEAWAAGMESAT